MAGRVTRGANRPKTVEDIQREDDRNHAREMSLFQQVAEAIGETLEGVCNMQDKERRELIQALGLQGSPEESKEESEEGSGSESLHIEEYEEDTQEDETKDDRKRRRSGSDGATESKRVKPIKQSLPLVSVESPKLPGDSNKSRDGLDDEDKLSTLARRGSISEDNDSEEAMTSSPVINRTVTKVKRSLEEPEPFNSSGPDFGSEEEGEARGHTIINTMITAMEKKKTGLKLSDPLSLSRLLKTFCTLDPRARMPKQPLEPGQLRQNMLARSRQAGTLEKDFVTFMGELGKVKERGMGCGKAGPWVPLSTAKPAVKGRGRGGRLSRTRTLSGECSTSVKRVQESSDDDFEPDKYEESSFVEKTPPKKPVARKKKCTIPRKGSKATLNDEEVSAMIETEDEFLYKTERPQDLAKDSKASAKIKAFMDDWADEDNGGEVTIVKEVASPRNVVKKVASSHCTSVQEDQEKTAKLNSSVPQLQNTTPSKMHGNSSNISQHVRVYETILNTQDNFSSSKQHPLSNNVGYQEEKKTVPAHGVFEVNSCPMCGREMVLDQLKEHAATCRGKREGLRNVKTPGWYLEGQDTTKMSSDKCDVRPSSWGGMGDRINQTASGSSTRNIRPSPNLSRRKVPSPFNVTFPKDGESNPSPSVENLKDEDFQDIPGGSSPIIFKTARRGSKLQLSGDGIQEIGLPGTSKIPLKEVPRNSNETAAERETRKKSLPSKPLLKEGAPWASFLG